MSLLFREEEINQERYRDATFREVRILPISNQANKPPQDLNTDWFNHEEEIKRERKFPKIRPPTIPQRFQSGSRGAQ